MRCLILTGPRPRTELRAIHSSFIESIVPGENNRHAAPKYIADITGHGGREGLLRRSTHAKDAPCGGPRSEQRGVDTTRSARCRDPRAEVSYIILEVRQVIVLHGLPSLLERNLS
jgi:hypothetical protein